MEKTRPKLIANERAIRYRGKGKKKEKSWACYTKKVRRGEGFDEHDLTEGVRTQKAKKVNFGTRRQKWCICLGERGVDEK